MIYTTSKKCEICGTALGFAGGFSVDLHKSIVVVDVESLDNLCFNCCGKVPTHIPRKQYKKWLKGVGK